MKTRSDVKINANKFRAELQKIMPGYQWTVHKPSPWPDEDNDYRQATGIQSAGFNRISTLKVTKRITGGEFIAETKYEVQSAGFGCRAPWLAEAEGGTLARALRRLQDHYESVASQYAAHARDLERGRKP